MLPITLFDSSEVPPPELPPIILADLIGGDEVGRDYLSLMRSAAPLHDHFRHCFATQRNTGVSATRHGHRFKDLRMANDLNDQAALTLCEQAVKPLIDAGYVRIQQIEQEVTDDQGRLHVTYRDALEDRDNEYEVY
jgi:hypothetical protein